MDTDSACPALGSLIAPSSTSTHWMSYNSANQAASSDTGGLSYDAAGNVIEDSLNKYVYDQLGRLCAVQNRMSGAATQYVYDGAGERVAKGTLTAMPAAGNFCAAPTAANGFTLTATYLRGTDSGGGGEQEVEIDSAGSPTPGAWHQNVFAAGELLATYDASGSGAAPTLSFTFNDWLGTKRLQVNAAGQLTNSWTSDPFGDYLAARVSSDDATEHHFTGKERDSESGNDYFEARYYSSAMGRFMSPDWAAQAEPVPYAKMDDPQSLNLYSYVRNNPLSRTDPDGHCCEDVLPAVLVGAEAAEGTIAGFTGGLVVLGGAALGAAAYSTAQGNSPYMTNGYPTTFNLNPTSSNTLQSKDTSASSGTSGTATNTGPKAATAAGVTAGGQATDKFGNKVGPSGKTQVDQVDHSSKKGAKDAARNEGKGAPEKHHSPTKGDPHYHPTDANGDKVPNSTHHNYPN